MVLVGSRDKATMPIGLISKSTQLASSFISTGITVAYGQQAYGFVLLVYVSPSALESVL